MRTTAGPDTGGVTPEPLAAGMSIFSLSRRMGTSVQMIDATYGHLAQDAEDQDRGLLDAYDGRNGACGHERGHEC